MSDSTTAHYPHLVWLRNDLRLDDNPALFKASQAGKVQVVFISTPEQWLMHNEPPAQLGLKADILSGLAARLAALGIPFCELTADLFEDVPLVLSQFCREQNINTVYFNSETPWDESRRDKQVCMALKKIGINTKQCDVDLLVSDLLLNKQGKPYKVFTPFYKAWQATLYERYGHCHVEPYPVPEAQGVPLAPPDCEPSWQFAYRDDLWASDEETIQGILCDFCENQLAQYHQTRDYPALDATSALSPYFAIGALGPRRILAQVQRVCPETWLEDDWLRELAWRDFYRQLLVHFPALNKGFAFKPETDQIEWQNDIQKFQLWCEGNTGFPIIDAAMRQLNDTGWMHNRLRMLVASFLTKLLFIDWRWGEAHFMRTLIDGDFAANNGGWQWSASTGCDASPYFRVFNPERQSREYDAKGGFIRQYVPELASLDNKSIHNPSADQREKLNYPQPILDYKTARQFAIDAFVALKNKA